MPQSIVFGCLSVATHSFYFNCIYLIVRNMWNCRATKSINESSEHTVSVHGEKLTGLTVYIYLIICPRTLLNPICGYLLEDRILECLVEKIYFSMSLSKSLRFKSGI
jgi:hypothetical protein